MYKEGNNNSPDKLEGQQQLPAMERGYREVVRGCFRVLRIPLITLGDRGTAPLHLGRVNIFARRWLALPTMREKEHSEGH